GRDANLRGIIFADLARIDVDLDELGVGDRERHTFAVGRCRLVCEAATEGHDHISIGGRVVAGQRSRPAAWAGAHRGVFGYGTLAIPGEDHGDAEFLD